MNNFSRISLPSLSNIVCYQPAMLTTHGVWRGDNPLDYSLPLFLLQIILVIITTRILIFLLKPFHQPRVVAEILGGIILGPSVLGQVKDFANTLFPVKSLLTLETVAHLGLLYFLFLIGVEMDILVITRMGRKALIIAFAGMVIPFSIGIGTAFLFRRQITHHTHEGPFLLFLGVALCVTAFPVLARILAEVKLLNTELGRISMSSAIINDTCAWVLLALSITLADRQETALSSLWVMLSGLGFVLVCFYVVRPAIRWLIRHTSDGHSISDLQVCFILTGVMLAAFVTDFIGIHSVFGAFVFGLVMPNGPFGEALVDKLEDFVNGFLLPLFFVTSGLKTNLRKLRNPVTVGLLVVVFVLANAGKILGTVLICSFYSMPLREGLTLGFLMSTRGLVEMIVLNIGRDKQVLDDESFAVMIILSVITTALIIPTVTAIHRPARVLLGYKRRNLQRSRPDGELRMLACVYSPRNVPTIISLLEISNPTKRSPIFVYALHLMELTGRSSTMLVAQSASSAAKPGIGAPSENMSVAFEQFEQRAGGVSIQMMAAMSPYPTMHEDVCGMAADKHVSFIVLPFHKHQTVDGGMEATNPGLRTVNEHVLAHAPCSVGILVDRGLSATSVHHLAHHVVVLFFGGPDDREALAYAWRMADHPNIKLAVIRFLPSSSSPTPNPRTITIPTSEDRELELDDEYFGEFRLKNLSNESVAYIEKVVTNSEDSVAVIRSMDSVYNMYIVGRGQREGAVAQLTAGLTEWSEYPELGPIGDLLASSDFAATVSVMVVQQYAGGVVESSPARSDQRARMQHHREQMSSVSAFSIEQNGRGS